MHTMLYASRFLWDMAHAPYFGCLICRSVDDNRSSIHGFIRKYAKEDLNATRGAKGLEAL